MMLDELVGLARRAEPPPLDDATARRILDGAVRGRSVPPVRRMRIAPLAAAVCAALAALWLVTRRAPSEPALLHLTLPTGDRIAGTAGARFELERLAPADRRLRLADGTALFDVAKLAPNQRFAVATPHLVATAIGTVFSVETDATHSRVRVFEGVVDVEQSGAHHALAAGATWDSRDHAALLATEPPAVLTQEVTAALDRRAATPVVRASADDAASIATTAATPTGDPVGAAHTTTSGAAVATAAGSSGDRAHATHASPAAALPLDRLLARAHDELLRGDFAAALATAKLAEGPGAATGPWRLVIADALRGLGRGAEAAAAFDAAAAELTGVTALEAGYSAAYLWFHDVHERERALVSIAGASLDASGSPLEERGLALHVQVLVALGRRDDAKPLAARYLAHFPHGELAALMRSLSP